MQLFGMEKISLVDYDGKVACTVFTGTCNFKCGFCHNSSLVLDTNRLKQISEEEVFSYLKKRKGIVEGVCITGGEPTLQKDLPQFCEKLKNEGLSVKLDTNGTNPQTVKALIDKGLCDYFAIDIKNSKSKYAEIIGLKTFDVSPVEKTVEILMTSNIGYEFRTTLIKEYHTEESMLEIAKWIKGAKKYCLQKFKPSENCITTGLNEVSVTKASDFLEIVKPYIPNSMLRGY